MKTALILIVVGHLVVSLPLDSPEKAEKSGKSEESEKSGKNGSESVCVSRDCISTAYHLMNNMNLTVDPCEDFFEVRKRFFWSYLISMCQFQQHFTSYFRANYSCRKNYKAI